MNLQCARCIATHGAPGCPATHTDLDGKPSCAWCEDGVACPIEQKRQRDARRKTPEEPPPAASDLNSEKPASEQKSGVTTMKTPETHPTSAPKRICARPGCTVELSPENTCGRCRAHVRWQAHPSSAGNGHADANSSGVNGSATKKNGNGHAASPANGSNGSASVLPDLAADRVEHLIATLSAGEKARIALAWLRGEL